VVACAQVPVTYQIDRETALIRTRCTGDVSFTEVVQHFRDLQEDASLPKGLDVLIDLTETRSIPESAQLRSVAREVELLRDKVHWGACAIVASRDVLFGMSRMFHAFAQEHFARSNVFRELEEAERWLASLRSRPG
jgi:SpoIIAA-like